MDCVNVDTPSDWRLLNNLPDSRSISIHEDDCIVIWNFNWPEAHPADIASPLTDCCGETHSSVHFCCSGKKYSTCEQIDREVNTELIYQFPLHSAENAINGGKRFSEFLNSAPESFIEVNAYNCTAALWDREGKEKCSIPTPQMGSFQPGVVCWVSGKYWSLEGYPTRSVESTRRHIRTLGQGKYIFVSLWARSAFATVNG